MGHRFGNAEYEGKSHLRSAVAVSCVWRVAALPALPSRRSPLADGRCHHRRYLQRGTRVWARYVRIRSRCTCDDNIKVDVTETGAGAWHTERLISLLHQAKIKLCKIEVFTAVTRKNGFFWDVTPCGSCKDRRFGET
jgi:hypothetical protein